MKVAIVSGSTRNGRKSHRVALALQRQFAALGHEVDLLDLLESRLEVFTERIGFLPEEERSPAMIDLSNRLSKAQAILFVTPEYNGGISASLKLCIDTMGRAEFSGKPIGVATVSDGVLGGVRAAYQLQQTILALQAYPQPQMLTVGEVDKQFDETGTLINPDYARRMQSFVTAFNGFMQRFA